MQPLVDHIAASGKARSCQFQRHGERRGSRSMKGLCRKGFRPFANLTYEGLGQATISNLAVVGESDPQKRSVESADPIRANAWQSDLLQPCRPPSSSDYDVPS